MEQAFPLSGAGKSDESKAAKVKALTGSAYDAIKTILDGVDPKRQKLGPSEYMLILKNSQE